MKKELLTILIVNYNSADFIKTSLWALARLTYNPFCVEIIDNNSSAKDYKKLAAVCKDYTNVSVTREKTKLTGSLAHGSALNKLATTVKTPYFSILDADATWLLKDWDKLFISYINASLKVIGTQAAKPKPQDFPLMYAIFFETKIFRSLKIDFCPQVNNSKKDTGYQLREHYKKGGYTGMILYLKNTRNYTTGPFSAIICAEYYLSPTNKKIVASHFGRGSSGGDQKYRHGNLLYRIPLLSKPFRLLRGRREKQIWLKTCERIVTQQIS